MRGGRLPDRLDGRELWWSGLLDAGFLLLANVDLVMIRLRGATAGMVAAFNPFAGPLDYA
jgi:hypothetical protein